MRPRSEPAAPARQWAAPASPPATAASFGAFVARARAAGRLVVQPRMGFGQPGQMRAGLLATKQAQATTVGTITLDSYTRMGDHAGARRALARREDLNGYPIVAHGAATTRAVLDGIAGPAFPVQVRHGSARPQAIVAAMRATGLHATEGGPVSYCLPYSRASLEHSVSNWARTCRLLLRTGQRGAVPHVETFGGCLLGQLCPPGLLVAMSILEALFFRQHGLRSVSLSYAQQTNHAQDAEAVRALRRLAGEYLGDVEWHVVVYAYMGLYPRTAPGALALLDEAAALALRTGAERLVVKTAAEAFRIPTIAENVQALERAARAAAAEAAGTTAASRPAPPPLAPAADLGIEVEARSLVEMVLELHGDVGTGLLRAFRRGYLDVPYCLHPDNAGRSRSYLDADGRLLWVTTAAMPISGESGDRASGQDRPADLLRALTYVQRKFDRLAAGEDDRRPVRQPALRPLETTPQEASS